MMFSKILIANRGEIACRVIKTARRLGVHTVAVYSDADANAKHVALADEAIRLGPPPVAESYLRGDLIIAAALACQAEAIHPGYGFLSENPDFVDAVEKSGLRFIGPSAAAIRAMGLKDAAKKLMQQAGVPIVPGYHGDSQDAGFLAAQAKEIGYPVLIKARAGGGGKGMRKVDDPRQFKAALEGAQREGKASFGDAHCLIEKWVTQPRHVEIQVFGDDHGNVVHLFERDCSLQRRHQKVIEEAPAPGMPDEMRKAMGEAAVKAAKAIGYSGAGTIEFIADSSDGLRADRFYFMEMNTRLQVEHPVTEAITGEDLVEWQLRVASGEALPKQQSELSINGWAFEARIYAEDAGKGFLPATGTLAHLDLPEASARIDSGVRSGDEITPWYDPMIAKLIVHGSDREAALNKLSAALAECRIAGSVTNLAFLSALARAPGFVSGAVDTGLIERSLSELTARTPLSPKAAAIAALAAGGLTRVATGNDPWEQLSGWRLWSEARQYVVLEHDGERLDASIVVLPGGNFEIEHGGATVRLRLDDIAPDQPGANRLRIDSEGRKFTARTVEHGRFLTVFLDGAAHEFALADRIGEAEEGDAGGDRLISPMPGLVKIVSAKAGDDVAKGQPLIVLEAMKMEHTLLAPRDGTVAEMNVAAGDQVQEGATLLLLVIEDV